MDPDVILDPVFQELLLKLELSTRKLRDAAIAMRSHYLTHDKKPQDEDATEQWRGAILSEEAALTHEAVEDAAAQLLRYAFELAPHSNCALHLEELCKLRLAHEDRLNLRTGWGTPYPHPRGIEERVRTKEGVPLTLVINPSAWEFTEKARRANAAREPAIHPEEDDCPHGPDEEPTV